MDDAHDLNLIRVADERHRLHGFIVYVLKLKHLTRMPHYCGCRIIASEVSPKMIMLKDITMLEGLKRQYKNYSKIN